jgi:ferredoxin
MSRPFEFKRAIVKWNGGRGALLCNRCRVIVREGAEHEDVEHYCASCRGIVAAPEAFPDSVIERIRKLEDEGK